MGTTIDVRFTFYTGDRKTELEPIIEAFAYRELGQDVDYYPSGEGDNAIIVSHSHYGSHSWDETYKALFHQFCDEHDVSGELALAWPDYRETCNDYDEYEFYGPLASTLESLHSLNEARHLAEQLASSLRNHLPQIYTQHESVLVNLTQALETLAASMTAPSKVAETRQKKPSRLSKAQRDLLAECIKQGGSIGRRSTRQWPTLRALLKRGYLLKAGLVAN